MQQIRPSVTLEDIICAEVQAPPNAMVVFGASGDLTHRKLLPSLFQVFKRGLLSEKFCLLGCGRKNLSTEQFRQIARQAVQQDTAAESTEGLDPFISRLYYLSGDYSEPSFYKNIKDKLAELNKKYKVDGGPLFYLAVPPSLYGTIVEHLGLSALSPTDRPDA